MRNARKPGPTLYSYPPMNHRERVLATVKHEEPDRVPVDYWGTPEVTTRLCEHFNVQNSNQLLKKLNVDIRYVKPSYKVEDIDIWGVVRREVFLGKNSYLEVQKSPLADIATAKEIEKCKFPNPVDFDYHSVGRFCGEYKDYAIICTGDRLTTRASIFKLAMYLRGMDKLFMDMALNPKLVQVLIAEWSSDKFRNVP
jgi:hypothetical protein